MLSQLALLIVTQEVHLLLEFSSTFVAQIAIDFLYGSAIPIINVPAGHWNGHLGRQIWWSIPGMPWSTNRLIGSEKLTYYTGGKLSADYIIW